MVGSGRMVERETPFLSVHFSENRQRTRSSARMGRPRTANANIASAASSLIGIATAVAATIFPVLNSSASSLPRRHVLTLDAARRVVSATEAEARQKGWPCVIAVVDSGGYLIALDRMDASPMLASAELAPAKARTAALFGKPTKALEDAIHGGRVAAITAGFVEMDGGMPLIVDGETVGAIGVSSAQPDWDVALAGVGAAALTQK